jgi:hypothetical protein
MRNGLLQRRLAALEEKAGINEAPPPNLILNFGRPSDRAEALGQKLVWNRMPDEAPEDFEQRVTADMRERGGRPWLLTFFPAQ